MTGGARDPEARSARVGSGQLRGMVAGLNAVVWERDPRSWRVRFVNERIEEVLGHPVADWLADPGLWSRCLHPEDRDRVEEAVRGAVADGQDFSLTYRSFAADGRLVWLHHLGHVARDDDGAAVSLHAVVIDITEQHRREQAAALLAAAGRVLTEPGEIEQRLTAVAALAVGPLCDRASVWLRGDDGLYRPVAGAPAELAAGVLALAPVAAPPSLEAAYRSGRPIVVPEVTDAMRRAATRRDEDYAAVSGIPTRSMLIVPLVATGQVVGLLSLAAAGGARRYDEADLSLAGELGQRIATTVAAERLAARERTSHDLAVALSAAAGVAEAAAQLAVGLHAALGALRVTVCTLGRDGLLHLEHVASRPGDTVEPAGPLPTTAPVPLADAVVGRHPVWLADRAAWETRYPAVVPQLREDTQAGAVLPLVVGGQVLGAVGLTFETAREFDAGERSFLLSLAGHAALAFERAALADTRLEIADTLQHSLLPRRLPELDGLSATARYVAGQRGTQAGGDWFDVLPLPDGRIAVAVGDVVGNGAAAAAVMGQLRSALAMLLLEGHPPARALELLDRFAARVEGARVSTAACLLLDPASGRLDYSRAGHPPPLVLGPEGACYLDDGLGPALDLPLGGTVRPEATVELRPGATLLLYTDGLVERRGEILDVGLERLAGAAAELVGEPPESLVDRLLVRLLGAAGPLDDIALVAVRLSPRPLHLELPADPPCLRVLRRAVLEWTRGTSLGADAVEDLLLAVGEAAANAVEHAYPRRDGRGRVSVTVADRGTTVDVAVSDTGTWRPPPVDPGFRGRGLHMIEGLARDVVVDRGAGGTTVRFRLAVPAASAVGVATATAAGAEGRSAAFSVSTEADRRRVQVLGDLDLAGVHAVGDGLRSALAPGPVILDLSAVGVLTSIGMALLTEILDAARRAGTAVDVVLPSDGAARRALDLTGLTATLAPAADRTL